MRKSWLPRRCASLGSETATADWYDVPCPAVRPRAPRQLHRRRSVADAKVVQREARLAMKAPGEEGVEGGHRLEHVHKAAVPLANDAAVKAVDVRTHVEHRAVPFWQQRAEAVKALVDERVPQERARRVAALCEVVVRVQLAVRRRRKVLEDVRTERVHGDVAEREREQSLETTASRRQRGRPTTQPASDARP